MEGGRRQVEKVKNSRFGVRGHPNHWGAEGSKAKKTALGSEVKNGGEGEREGGKRLRAAAVG